MSNCLASDSRVAVVEPLSSEGRLDKSTARLERASHLVIVVAYLISVALYLRIMAQLVVDYIASGSGEAERLLAVGVIVLITLVGLVRGLSGLELLERVALGAVLVLVLAIGVAFAGKDGSNLAGGSLHLPPVPGAGLGSVLLVLGGIVITVQDSKRFATSSTSTAVRGSPAAACRRSSHRSCMCCLSR